MAIRILGTEAVVAALPMPRAIQAMRQAFRRLSAGETAAPQRQVLAIPESGGLALFMPAHLIADGQLGIKISSITPGNPALGLPLVNGLVVLIDPATGRIEALLDGAAITAIRTGAASGLATDLLARRDARGLAIIGSGVQARAQMEGVCAVRAIERVWIYSKNRRTAEQLADATRGRGRVPEAITIVDSARLAVAEADVICTATSTDSATAILGVGDLRPGVHVNAVGGRSAEACEIDPRVFAGARVVVDLRSAALHECGEIRAAVAAGYLQECDLVELGEIVDGARATDDAGLRITVFRSVGLAIQDVSAAAVACQAAAERGLGEIVHTL